MAYAHQGVEIKPLYGVAPSPTPPRPAVAAGTGEPAAEEPPRPVVLTKRAAEILVQLERRLDEAARSAASAAATPPANDTSVAAREGPPTVRGN
jgi:penicillin-binding protein 1A